MAHMANPLATPAQLHVRSALQVLPTDLLDAVLVATQSLTQAAGLLLELPQSSTARANVVLARYWVVEPPMGGRRSRHDEFSDISAACLYIVAKLGPIPRSPRDIATVYTYLLSSSSPFMRPPPSSLDANPDPNSYYLSEHAYHAFHTRLIALEASVLTALSFDTHVALPHGLAITYLQTLSLLGPQQQQQQQQQQSSSSSGSPLARRAIALLNAALLSPQLVYLTHQPNALATAAIYAAARDVGVRMPASEWWEVFDVDREELGFLVVALRSLEGYLAKLREDIPGFGTAGMVSVRGVKEELKRRGMSDVAAANNGGGGDEDEDEMMRLMDQRTAADVES